MREIKRQIPAAVAVILVLLICVAAYFHGSADKGKSSEAISRSDDIITVHYIDVGQGDSEFVELPNGECMLIDAGTKESFDTISQVIESCGYDSINYVVATHPHADHIGSMSQIIDEYDIGEFYMPKVSSTSKTYENMIDSLNESNVSVFEAKAGVNIFDYEDMSIDILAPSSESYEETNDYSAVIKITYGANSFLFCGDAETESETEMLFNCTDKLSADVIKIGHHGSDSSTSEEFLSAVSPQYAVISCGAGNSYGHPHTEVLERLEKHGVETYRTDDYGDITISCGASGGFNVEYEDD